MADSSQLTAIPTTYLVNRDAEFYERITVELTCFAGEGPHKPLSDTWAVRKHGWCLDVDGDWIYEPQPSSRDAAFYARTRWDVIEAIARAQEAARRDAQWRADNR